MHGDMRLPSKNILENEHREADKEDFFAQYWVLHVQMVLCTLRALREDEGAWDGDASMYHVF